MNIVINKSSNQVIYKQIVSHIIESIRTGELIDGDKLPSERELSKQLEVSRGTITKAYNELEKLLVVTLIKGKGCFVSKEIEYLSLDRKEKAIKIIKKSIKALEDLEFTLAEIRIFTELVLMEQDKKYRTIRIGIIDCSKEALHAIKCQMGNIKDISVKNYILDDINTNQVQSDILDNDMVITTYTHYDSVKKAITDIQDILVRVSMTPSKRTYIQIGRITNNAKIGVLYDSMNFLGVIRKALTVGEINVDDTEVMDINNSKEVIAHFIKHKEVLIIPPLNYYESSYAKWLMQYLERKQYIEFEYVIERGNLLNLEEKIRRLMIQK